MRLGKKHLPLVLGAALNVGGIGQASADVYGLSTLELENVQIIFTATGGLPGLFTFSTNQDATLNSVSDPSSGAASCVGNFPSAGTCTGSAPVLSGTVQNAPGSGVIRAENDYQVFGQVAEYSNAEAAVVSALLLGDSSTSTSSISESNLQTGTTAQGNTTISSNTNLNLTFAVGPPGGSFIIDFDAALNVLTEVNGGDNGIAQANSGVTVLLQEGGNTLASWAPTGNNTVSTCAAGLSCVAVESPLSLNNTTSSNGAPNQVAGSGNYRLTVSGLTSGSYTLALATTTSTDLARQPGPPPPPPSVSIPVQTPGALVLLGCGLLLTGWRALRRKS